MTIPSLQPYDSKYSMNGEQQPKPGKKELTADDFIKLFIKQLMMQNPMHPTDSTSILQQMANISSMSASKEMQNAMNTFQQHMDITLGNSQFLAATQLIGKKIELPRSVSELQEGDILSGSVVVPGATNGIKVTIKDDADRVVKEITLDPTTSGGLVDFTWDGKKADNTAALPGLYKISAKATIDGKEMDLATLGAFKVKSIAANHSTGELVLNIDGLGGVNLTDIVKII